MSQDAFFKLFVKELRDLYSGENQLLEILPRMKEGASTPELAEAFQNHLQDTRKQKDRLETIFTMLHQDSHEQGSTAMEGLISEVYEVLQGDFPSMVKDAALIVAAQRIEHYKMAGYGAASTFADQLDYSEASDLLEESLQEVRQADKKLVSIAKGGFFTAGVNKLARKE
jgi:ferritin-like metal-binding protein YciE